jgi:predicted dehydrogenase
LRYHFIRKMTTDVQMSPSGLLMREMDRSTRRGTHQVSVQPKSAIRIAMIGGGDGAFIGAVHRSAMALDGRFHLVAGAFSGDAAKSRRSAQLIGLQPEMGFADTKALLRSEVGQALDAVSIVTPNHLHHSQVLSAVKAGLAIFCEKPLSCTLDEAHAIGAAVSQSKRPFAVAHAYSAYPMVEQARHMIAIGKLGKIRRVDVGYLQGWMAQPIEKIGQKQASWRSDPKLAGAGASADIATHAHHMLEHLTGDRLHKISARLSTLVDGRAIDDDVSMIGEMASGARVTLTASQIAIGRANGLTISVYGEAASITWRQEEPDTLWFCPDGEPEQRWIAGSDKAYLCDAARALCRTPSGHPMGFIEAFANLYGKFGDQILAGVTQALGGAPSLVEAVRGMAFLNAAARSNEAQGAWTAIEDVNL